MSKIVIKKHDVLWSYFAQILNIGANLVLLPITLHILSSETYGIWQIFVSLYLFFNLLDFGFRPTFMRNVAYVYGGATSLIKKGINHNSEVLSHPNYPLLKSLSISIRKFYLLMSVIILIIALTLGTYYISNISEILPDQTNIIYAWISYVIAISLSFYLLYHSTMLNGCGHIKECNQILIASKIVYVAVSILLLYLDFGLLSIGLGMLASAIVNYVTAKYYLIKTGLVKSLRDAVGENIDLFKVIGHNAMRVGIVNVSLFFTNRGILFLAPLFLSLDIVAQYGLTLQIIGILTMMGQLYLQTNIPLIAQYRVENDLGSIRNMVGKTFSIYILLYFAGAIFILLLGNILLSFIGSNTYFLETIPLIFLVLIYFLDMNHNIALQVITTKNIVPHLWACVINGIFITTISFVLLAYTDLGIYSLLISVGLVQLVYQNWKWPLEVAKDLDTSYFGLIKLGFRSLFRKYNF